MKAIKVKRACRGWSWMISCFHPALASEVPAWWGPLSNSHSTTSSQLLAKTWYLSLKFCTSNCSFLILCEHKQQWLTQSFITKQPNPANTPYSVAWIYHSSNSLLITLSFGTLLKKLFRHADVKRHCSWSRTLLGSSPTRVFWLAFSITSNTAA